MTIRELLLRRDLTLTVSEEKIARVLLADYPAAGLGTATALARRAGVSDPTVVRLAIKLGFSGYPDFQSTLLQDVDARLHSPLQMMEAKRPESKDDSGDGPQDGAAVHYLRSVAACLDKAVVSTPAQTYERGARLVADRKATVTLLGGRFSRHLSGMLAGYLAQLRPGVTDLGILSPQTFDRLIDIGRRDVLVVFDYRRYQRDVISFAAQAQARGARIVLFTDPWLSPVAEHAEVTVVSPMEAASPYDTLAPAVAQVEAFVACLLTAMDDKMRKRITRLEDVRHANQVTLDHDPVSAADMGAGAAQPRSFLGPKSVADTRAHTTSQKETMP